MKVTHVCPRCMKDTNRLIQVAVDTPLNIDTTDPFCVKCLEKVELAFIKDLKRKKALGTYDNHTWYTRAAYFSAQGIRSIAKSLV